MTRIKTIFIEVTLTKKHLEREILNQKLERDIREGRMQRADTLEAGQAWREKVQEYKKLYVTMQEDGSEDDLSYIKLINYGERVLTNRMRAYLPQRIGGAVQVASGRPIAPETAWFQPLRL